MCDSRKYPYPPPRWSTETPRGWGLKGRKGGWARENFPGRINVANHTTQTYGKYFDLQRPKTLK